MTINASLSAGLNGGDTLVGGAAASDNLTIGSTSNSARGFINLRDRVIFLSEDKTFSTTTTPVIAFDTTATRTITFSSATTAGNSLTGFELQPTVVYAANSAAFAGFGVNISPTIKNDTSARTINIYIPFLAAPTFTSDTALTTSQGMIGFESNPTFNISAGGTLTGTGSTGFVSQGTVGTGITLTNFRHFQAVDVANTGTVTTQVGIEIPALAGATTNIGLRNASTTVYTNTTATLTAVGNSIPNTATFIRLNNTSGGSLTLTSAPTIADGQQGQVLYLVNTSANDVVLQDQGTLASSNLRLSATTITLSTRDSIALMFNTNVGDWCQFAQTNVL
jgi:hypothetical protein